MVQNADGELEYSRGSGQSKLYHVEEVLTMIDVGRAEGGGADRAQEATFQNEIMQLNYLSQLYVGLNVYSLLFHQLGGLLNKDRIQSVLVLNGSDPHSIMDMQVLIKRVGVTMITCTTDSFENQKFLQDHFTNQSMNIVFTPTERDTCQRCMEITNGLGYDLILDFSGGME